MGKRSSREGLGNEEDEMERIEIDIEERLRHEAMVCRNPPVEYVVGEDGDRVVHRPNPDYAMAELLEDAAKVIAGLRGELAKKDAEIARLRGRLSNLVEAVDDLIAESEGVYGLRLNGDPSLWEELIEVGWLLALEEAKAALDGEKE